MNTVRRSLLLMALFSGSAFGVTAPYPNRVIKIIVPFPAGGGTDNLARLIASKLTETLGWTVVVDNRPGAGGNLALDVAAKAPADGYTLLISQTDNAVLNPLLYSKLSYDPFKDFTPIGLAATGPLAIVVRADSRCRTLADIVSAAKVTPGQISFATPGIGTTAHLTLELWQKNAGVKFTHVPYRGMAQAFPDLMSGQIDIYLGSVITLQSMVASGVLRALGVTSPHRTGSLPQVPTFAEAGFPGIDISSVWGLMAPTGTPPEVVNRLNTELNKVLALPDVRKKITSSGADILSGSPRDMAEQYKADFLRLAPIVKQSGAKLE